MSKPRRDLARPDGTPSIAIHTRAGGEFAATWVMMVEGELIVTAAGFKGKSVEGKSEELDMSDWAIIPD